MIDKLEFVIMSEKVKAVEAMIELHLQPKPFWMPKFVWKWLISKILMIKEYGHGILEE